MRKIDFIIARMAVFACLFGMAAAVSAQGRSDSLEQGFKNPPDAAKPRTWWHWTGGNVTQEGITKDLEWMKRVGIGGYQLADVSSGSGQTVEHKLLFGTPEWLDAVRHAAAEGERLGLEMSIFSSPGWSEAGGPWVKPSEAMKKLVWSETHVEGPTRFAAKLPQPPSSNGPVGNLSVEGGRTPQGTKTLTPYYGDSVVLAFPSPSGDVGGNAQQPKVTTSAGSTDTAPLFDGDLNTAITLPAPANGAPAWIEFAFDQPYVARALTLGSRTGIPVGRILASNDGAAFRTLAVLPGPQGYHGARLRTFAFPQASARFYRVELTGAPLTPAAIISGTPPAQAREYVLTEVALHGDARVNRWEDKAASGSLMDTYDAASTPEASEDAGIRKSSVVNLTAKMAKDGSLDWEVPPGQWTILRMGYSLTGGTNHPAAATGFGYEVDKFNADYVANYFHGYMDPIAKTLGPLTGKSLQYMTMDSWEAGMQNWTDDMIGEFTARRGYDPTPYLPVLAGRVVQSGEVSDRFLWDFRRTMADLYADKFYGTMEKMLSAKGMKSYGEASGVALEIPEDSLLNKSKVDIPMAEFWVHSLHPESMYYVDVRGAASTAHIYGKPIVATESFTGGSYESPYTLKKVADYWFAQGVNRLVFHTSAQQPLDTKPGNVMVGTNLNRNITWAEQAAPLMTYFARVSYLLQQGDPVADIAYLLPEGAPSTMPFWGAGLQPAPPAGYDYDYVNTDILLHRTSIAADGRIHIEGSSTMSDGMNYRVLVLPQTTLMTPEVLHKLHELVSSGAVVVGERPLKSPSLAGYPEGDEEVAALASDLWGDMDGVTVTQHVCGKGLVVWGLPLQDVLAKLNFSKDFEASHPLDADLASSNNRLAGDPSSPASAPLISIHRKTADADIYFVSNQTDSSLDVSTRYRVNGKNVEIWHPDTGMIEPAGYSIEDGLTTVPLHLAEQEAVFVVFRHEAATQARVLPGHLTTILAKVDGLWEVHFQRNLGAPATAQFAGLKSWTEDPTEGIKYFSGTATYAKTLQVPQAWLLHNTRVLLDLGSVKDIAEVSINGTKCAVLWKPPYRVDVTSLLKPGINHLEIAVTNEWTNRIIGDRLLPQDAKVLAPVGNPMGGAARPAQGRNNAASGPRRGFSDIPQVPVESGLIGPVVLLSVTGSDQP